MRDRDRCGNEFKNIGEAYKAFCAEQDFCSDCPLHRTKTGKTLTCGDFVKGNRAEAVQIMGLWVIQEGEDINVLTKQEEENTTKVVHERRYTETMNGTEVLEAARKCVCGERAQNYGNPERNLQTIANFWIDYLSAKDDPLDLVPKDVAAMLVLLKVARVSSGHAKMDNWIDIAGYAACGGECEETE